VRGSFKNFPSSPLDKFLSFFYFLNKKPRLTPGQGTTKFIFAMLETKFNKSFPIFQAKFTSAKRNITEMTKFYRIKPEIILLTKRFFNHAKYL